MKNEDKYYQQRVTSLRAQIQDNFFSNSNNPTVRINIKSRHEDKNNLIITYDIFNDETIEYSTLLIDIAKNENTARKELDIQPFFITMESTIEDKTFFDLMDKMTSSKLDMLEYLSDDLDSQIELINSILDKKFFKISFVEKPFEASILVTLNLAFSPSKLLERYILLSEETYNEMYLKLIETYEDVISEAIITNKDVLENELANYTNPKYMTILNVGQANSQIVHFETMNLFYDLGLPAFSSDKPYDIARFNYENAKESNVVLSHWHEDHFLGVRYFNIKKNRKWITPSTLNCVEKISRNALDLSLILYIENKLMMIPYSIDFLLCFNEITIANGRGSICNLNESGLLFSLEKNHKIILPGDCMYKYWPDHLMLLPDILLVPHHGARLQEDVKFLRNSTLQGIAITSYGKNTYGHPNLEHIKKLVDKQYDVISTVVYEKYLKKPLTLTL